MANYSYKYEMVWLNINKEKETIDIEFKKLLVNDTDPTDTVEKSRFIFHGNTDKYQILKDITIDAYALDEDVINTTIGEYLEYLCNCAGNLIDSNFSIESTLLEKFGTDGVTILSSSL